MNADKAAALAEHLKCISQAIRAGLEVTPNKKLQGSISSCLSEVTRLETSVKAVQRTARIDLKRLLGSLTSEPLKSQVSDLCLELKLCTKDLKPCVDSFLLVCRGAKISMNSTDCT